MSSSAVVCHLSVLSRPLDPRPAAPCAPVRSMAAVALGVLFADDRGGDGEELVATALRGPDYARSGPLPVC